MIEENSKATEFLNDARSYLSEEADIDCRDASGEFIFSLLRVVSGIKQADKLF